MKWYVKAGLAFFCVVLGLCSSWGSVAWLINHYAQQDETRSADAAIVLGAAVARGRPSAVFRERINHAVALYQQGYVETLIFTGSVGWGDELSEAAVGRMYAIEKGVPAEDILLEEYSTNTIENLYYARQVAQANGVETFLIVSTPYHMKRALEISDDLEMEAYSSPTRTIRWLSPFTQFRALVQETVSYGRYRWIKWWCTASLVECVVVESAE